MPRSPRSPRAARSAHPTRSPAALDVAAFCRDGAHLQGQRSPAELPRFAQSLLRTADGAAERPIEWIAEGSLQAGTGGAPQCVVDLNIRATPMLECQRCLQPMTLPLQVERRFRFVEGEDEAARLDEELDDDVLALAPRFDLLALVEDELLLALPLVPRHDVCPELPAALRAPEGGNVADAPPKEERDNPFAALAALRRPRT
ncbi:MAG: DUF177 domain-containing protein [Burkholderiales bacterium]|nr:DUF177 domain-containing protein [Burkholderiales bacterium]